jgi:hypothetical protein
VFSLQGISNDPGRCSIDLQILPKTGIRRFHTSLGLLHKHDFLIRNELSSTQVSVQTSLFYRQLRDSLAESLFIRLRKGK